SEFGWWLGLVSLSSVSIAILKPGVYSLHFQDSAIGALSFILVTPEPLTDERKAAIRSNPFAAKSIQLSAVCVTCQAELKTYAGLDRSVDLESQNYVWYENLPLTFSCKCGAANCDLASIRKNLHAFLGVERLRGTQAFVPLYQKGVLENVRNNF